MSEDRTDVTYFTDHSFHNIGVMLVKQNVVAMARQAEQVVDPRDMPAVDRTAIRSDLSVLGRFLVTRKESEIGAFKTPGLRNLLLTAPYFHDGSRQTLWDVMDHYNKGGDVNDPNLDRDMQPLALKEPEITDLVAFLASLTSPNYRKPALKELARQRKLARITRPYRDTRGPSAPHPFTFSRRLAEEKTGAPPVRQPAERADAFTLPSTVPSHALFAFNRRVLRPPPGPTAGTHQRS